MPFVVPSLAAISKSKPAGVTRARFLPLIIFTCISIQPSFMYIFRYEMGCALAASSDASDAQLWREWLKIPMP